ncbi:putative Ig domain-containing protein [Luteimonas sp. RIT-PG2_3]
MSGPIRGMHDVEGKLFVVSGNVLYQISNERIAIPRGTIPGVGRVSMEHNQVAGGNQLLVVNGDSGYVWNTADSTFTKVTDTGFPGGSTVGFLDGYLCLVEPFGRYLFHSDLADALSYNTLDRFEAETAPDRNIASLIVNQEWWVFGERTTDVFGNTGQNTGTFQNKGVSISKGCAARAAVLAIDNGAMWLGSDLVVYHARGYDPIRVSTRAIETALSKCSPQAIANAFMFKWESRGHSVAYLTIPGEQTWGYDFSTGLWHRRASYSPVFDISGRWRLSDLVFSNGMWIGGDYQTGKLFELDWDYMLEEQGVYVRERVTPPATNNMSKFTVDAIKIDFGGGEEETIAVDFPTPQPPDANITINGTLWPEQDWDEPLTASYTATGGTAPYFFYIASGSLPPGLVLNGDGTVIGTPSQTGLYQWRVGVSDSLGRWKDKADSTYVVAPPFYLLHYYEDGPWVDYGSLGLTFNPSVPPPTLVDAPGDREGKVAYFTGGAKLTAGAGVTVGFSDWTMETEIFNAGVASTPYVMGFRPSGVWTGLHLSTSGQLLSGWIGDANSPYVSMTVDRWHHIVWQRRGTAFELFIDGVLVSTYTSSAGVGTAIPEVGGASNIYLRETRFTLGKAIYPTAGFAPPTGRFKPVSTPIVEP